ncbi:ATP-binding protein [Larkinella soli]|uniref:ATP-binding protein n=1 Tax=Larkinella soli TaxID=1770527 RepID=UPI000FFC1E77|nr:ATP-binding protein [Larkinella soli]
MTLAEPVRSPFKFLDAYTAGDTDRFFGRQNEQKRLVELVYSSRLILIYGSSGAGKSSLVQCGLAKAISLSDYFPVIIRRRDHFPDSLDQALSGILGPDGSALPGERIRQLAQYVLRNVYLIFDQFEEIFISGSQEEQRQFFTLLKAIYESGAPCKLFIVMREEYIAHLYPFEEDFPGLFDFRLRVEPMSERNLEEVIVGTLQHTDGVYLEESEASRLILRNTFSGKGTFQLPYLQVYLDRLWRTALQKNRDSGFRKTGIDSTLVEEVGPIEDVLELFLNEQRAVVAADLPASQQPAVGRVLEAFVTYEGTRREQSPASLARETGLEPSLVIDLLARLENARILRSEDGRYELPHDSLAQVIDQSRSAEQRQINAIIRRLKEAFREYQEKHRADDLLLSERRLTEVQLHEDTIKTELDRTLPDSAEIWSFVETSRRQVARLQAETEAARRAVEQAKLEEQKAKNRRLRWTVAGALLLSLLAVASMIYALRQEKQAQRNEQAALKGSQALQAALNMVTLQKASDLYHKGRGFFETEEYRLALGAFVQADSVLRHQLQEPVAFPEKEAGTASQTLQQLRKNLPVEMQTCQAKLQAESR